MATRKSTTKAKTFEIPKLSANPAERIVQLNELSERAQGAMKEALNEAREAGHSWSDIAKQTGIPNSTLRRLGGYKPPAELKQEAPVKKVAAKKVTARIVAPEKKTAAKKSATKAPAGRKTTAAKKTTSRKKVA